MKVVDLDGKSHDPFVFKKQKVLRTTPKKITTMQPNIEMTNEEVGSGCGRASG
jgi:hypothetical protein